MPTAARAVVCYYDTVDSPIGPLTLTSDGEFLTALSMAEQPPPGGDAVHDPAGLKRAANEVRAYLAGELTEFTLLMRQSGTPFQKRVWEELTAIPYGETISYAELARRVGQAGAARAVGSANGKNRLGIVVPCHRVIASGGALGGYGGGLWRKEWLLAHERKNGGK